MATKQEIEKQVIALQKLGLSENEIAEILETDKRIDRGEKLFELPDELKQGAKKARQAERKAPAEPVKRERKVNDDKRFLIDFLVKTLSPEVDKPIEISNPEREFTFEYNGKKYRITMACPRS